MSSDGHRVFWPLVWGSRYAWGNIRIETVFEVVTSTLSWWHIFKIWCILWISVKAIDTVLTAYVSGGSLVHRSCWSHIPYLRCLPLAVVHKRQQLQEEISIQLNVVGCRELTEQVRVEHEEWACNPVEMCLGLHNRHSVHGKVWPVPARKDIVHISTSCRDE